MLPTCIDSIDNHSYNTSKKIKCSSIKRNQLYLKFDILKVILESTCWRLVTCLRWYKLTTLTKFKWRLNTFQKRKERQTKEGQLWDPLNAHIHSLIFLNYTPYVRRNEYVRSLMINKPVNKVQALQQEALQVGTRFHPRIWPPHCCPLYHICKGGFHSSLSQQGGSLPQLQMSSFSWTWTSKTSSKGPLFMENQSPKPATATKAQPWP